jgi:hypothetical protein
MTLKAGEFIRRLLIHVLPNGFHRIRHYGLLASGTKAQTIARAISMTGATGVSYSACPPTKIMRLLGRENIRAFRPLAFSHGVGLFRVI